MFGLKKIPEHRTWGIISILCPVAAFAFIAFLVALLEEPYEPGEGLADFYGVFILSLFLWMMPISGLIGLLLAIRSFVLQPRINGIGLWGMALNAILIILLAFIWTRSRF